MSIVNSSLSEIGATSRLRNLISDVINIKLLRKTPAFYYDKVDNVGDKLNGYLLRQVTGRETYIVKTRKFPHVLPTGSILHFSSSSSYVWGSGLISPDRPKTLKFRRILALRGNLTLAEIRKRTNLSLDIPLGDPALLMPQYYQPSPGAKRYRIGVVPHYVDQDSELLAPIRQLNDAKLISVQQNYDSFINELTECDFVLSSSLHGLILADVYGIPNKWISLSNKIIGGEFKFKDYYSTTTNADEGCFYLKSGADFLALTESVNTYALVKKYTGDLDKLEQALKNCF